jgi:conjugal transfer ATP-binding protein TraC
MRRSAEELTGRKGSLGNTLSLLPHLDIVDGVVFLENGRAEVGVRVNLPSLLFSSGMRAEEDWRNVRNILHLAIPLGYRARYYLEAAPDRGHAIREYREAINTPFKLAKEIAESRANFLERERARGQLLQWGAYITLSAPIAKPKKVTFSPETFQDILTNMLGLRQRLVEFLNAAGWHATPMDTQEVFDLLWRYLNPAIASVPAPPYRSWTKEGLAVIPGQVATKVSDHLHQPTARAQAAGSIVENYSDRFLNVGGKLIDAVALYSPPDDTFIGMLGRVVEGLPGTVLYLVVEYQHEPLDPLIAKLQGDARKYMALAEGEGMRDLTAKSKLKEVEKAIDALMETGDRVYRSSVSVIFAANDVDSLAILRERVLSALGTFAGARPTYGGGLAFRLFFQMAPFNGEISPHTFIVPSTNAADFAPTSLPWQGMPKPTAIYRNRFNAITGINAFDQRASNWNGLVVAGSGSGKTFFMQGYLASLLAQGNAEVMIVDRGYGYAPLVEALAGPEVIIPIEPGSVSINPFDLPPGVNTPSEEKKAFVFAILRSMVPPSEDPQIAALEDAILLSAIDQTYKRKAPLVKDPITGEYAPKYEGARLSDLVGVLLRLDDVGGRAATPQDKAIAQNLATRFQVWTGDTPLGTFVDRPTSIRTDFPVIYFETTGLDRYPQLQGPGLLLLTDIIWRRAEKDPSVRKLVVMDEVWAMLKIPQARQLIVELYRRARRYNTAIYSVSQSILDFAEVRGIIQNTTYFFLGRLPEEEHKAIVEILGAPEPIKRALASLRMIRGKYSEWIAYTFLEGRPEGEVIRVEASPLEYWIYTTNPADMARRKSLMQEKGLDIVEAARILGGEV